jgi:hypothetical protein
LRKPADGFLSELASPALRALMAAGVTTLEKLSKWSEGRVLDLHGMGPNSVRKLRALLAKKGLQFARQ